MAQVAQVAQVGRRYFSLLKFVNYARQVGDYVISWGKIQAGRGDSNLASGIPGAVSSQTLRKPRKTLAERLTIVYNVRRNPTNRGA